MGRMRIRAASFGAALGAVGWMGLALLVSAANPDGDLRIEVKTAYNFVVDSNVETPATYGPSSAYVGAEFCNDGTDDLTDVFAYIGDMAAGTPGIYPVEAVDEAANGWLYSGDFSLTHEGPTSDATRYIGTIPAGECVTQYWLVSYPSVDANNVTVAGATNDPNDDLVLEYDIWATATDGAVSLAADETRTATMRNEISAMANKIWPNTTSKVPDEYLDIFEAELGWRPDQTSQGAGTVNTIEGIWYDFGNVRQGFDNNGDLVPDYNAWAQPVGDPEIFDPACFRLVRTFGFVIIKLNDGTEQVIPFEDQMYFENIPDNNTGAVGLVYYEFAALDGGCSVTLSPYQEVASGFDNEKFNADFGRFTGRFTTTDPSVDFTKSGPTSIAPPGTITYTLAATNTGTVDVGSLSLGVPLVIEDSIPEGTVYELGSATADNSPDGEVTVLYDLATTGLTTTEPTDASLVVGLQWWLDTAFEPGDSMVVHFAVSMPGAYEEPAVENEGCIGIGGVTTFDCDTSTTFKEGTLTIGDTVFADDGGTSGILGDGVQSGGEAGISDVAVTLYVDIDGDGVATPDVDLVWGTAQTNATGAYSFTNLPDGDFVVVVDSSDDDIPSGWGVTTGDSHAVALDGADYLDADFGFAPALTLDKATVSSPVVENAEVTYEITIQNHLSPDGLATYCTYEAWTTMEGGSNARWVTPELAVDDASGPNGTYASNDFDSAIYIGDGIDMGPDPGATITSVEALVHFYVDSALTDDTINVGGWWDHNQLPEHTIPTSVLNDYVGAPGGTFAYDLTADRSWVWADFVAPTGGTGVVVRAVGDDGANIYVDALGYRLVTDEICLGDAGFDEDSTVSPLPLEDTYDPSKLQFVSASPEVSSHDAVSGTLSWDDVGPLNGGAHTTVTVTFLALDADAPYPDTITNTATVLDGAAFVSGLPANTPTDDAVDDLHPAGSISGVVWSEGDGGTSGWVGSTGYESGTDLGVPGVTVELYVCVFESTGDVVDVNDAGYESHSDCAGQGGGGGDGAWVLLRSLTTDENGEYSFVGLPDEGFYHVVVDSSSIPGTTTQTAEANDDQTAGGQTCGTCDDTWGVLTSSGGGAQPGDLNTNNFNYLDVDTSEDIVDVNFGYDVQPSIFGELWEDVDGDGVRDPGDGPLSGWTVELDDGVCTPGSTCSTTTTATDGSYSFTGLTSGTTVTVTVTTPSGETWTQTFETDGTIDNSTEVTPLGGEISGSWDFGFTQSGSSSVGDTIFYDWDADGTQDASDEGIPGVTVRLYRDEDGDGEIDQGVDALVSVTTTTASGGYLFDNLPAGDYVVVVEEGGSSPLVATQQTADPDVASGPCAGDECDGQSDGVTLSGTNANLLQDFGYQPLGEGAIGDTVFLDSNGDGIQTDTEAGIAGITVTLLVDLNSDGTYVEVASTETDADGNYRFENLPDADYRVEVHTGDTDLPEDGLGNPVVSSTASTVDVTITQGSTVLDADFGFTTLGSIGDTVFADENGDGTQGWEEAGIDGVVVELWQDVAMNGSYTLVTTTTTDADGKYLFSGLAEGSYQVVVDTDTLPYATVTQTSDPDRDGVPCDDDTYPSLPACDDMESAIEVGLGSSYMGADFGYQPPGVLGDTVWYDADGDGVQGFGEVGIPGVTLTVTDGTDTYTATTDVDGIWSVGDLADGSWTVTVDASNFDPGGPLEGLSQTYDSDGTGTAHSSVAVISGGSVDLDQDFGYRLEGTNSLAGTVCLEGPGADGVCETPADEVLIEGLAVYLYNSAGRLVGSATTDENGNYLFDDLPDDTYTVVISSQTTPLDTATLTTSVSDTPATALTDTGTSIQQVVPVSGGAVTDVDFAFDPDVDYDFGDLPAVYGSTYATDGARHTVPTSPTLYLGGAPDTELDGVASADATADGADEDGVTPIDLTGWTTGTDGGSVDIDVVGTGYLVGWIDWNGDGDFLDEGEMVVSQSVATGTETVLFDIPDGAFAPGAADLYARFRIFEAAPLFPQLAFNGAAENGEVEDYRWTLPSGSIGDTVWLDENGDGVQDPGEDGLANVTVELLDANGMVVATTQTDGTGGYLFDEVIEGTYTVRVASASLPAGLVPTYDEDGIAPPLTSSVSLVAGTEHETADFGLNYVPPADTTAPGSSATGAIGDRIWLDADGDGIQDPEEAGIGGVVVTLYGDADGDGVYDTVVATTTTSADGRYIFDGLDPAGYVVGVDDSTLPGGAAGYTQTGDPDEPGATASLADDRSNPIVLAPGDVYVNADFGYQPTEGHDIGDRIFLDADGDGTYDAGEPGIAGVTVALLDATGDTVATATTDSTGAYLFPSLPDGEYTVRVTDTNHVLGELVQTADPDTVADGSSDVTLAGADALDQDFGYAPEGHDEGEGLIGNTIFLDGDGDGSADPGEGLEGVVVTLTASDGMTVTTTTDENGNYSFGGLDPAGTYTVTVDATSLAGGLSNSVDPDGGADSTAVVDLSASGGIDLDQDFGYVPTTPNSISGTLWEDIDSDGTLESGETARYAGVTVELRDASGNVVAKTTTDANGDYSFPNVPDGSYTVHVTDEDNVLGGAWSSDGPNDGADDNSQTQGYSVTVTGGQSNPTADFGYFRDAAALGNFVWDDTNDPNGIQEAGEAGIDGVLVELEIVYPGADGIVGSADDITVTLVTVTGDDPSTPAVEQGWYSFGNLLLDEDFSGDGSTSEPSYTLRVVDSNYDAGGALEGMWQTNLWRGGNTNLDADFPTGTAGQPIRGTTDTSATNITSAETSIDFGFVPVGTTPVNLAFFSTEAEGQGVRFEWWTSAETGNMGFAIYGVQGGESTLISEPLVPSAVMDGVGPQRYTLWLDAGDYDAYRIADIDLLGRRRFHGPFASGEAVGAIPQDDPIDWDRVAEAVARLDGRRRAELAARADAIVAKAALDADAYGDPQARAEALARVASPAHGESSMDPQEFTAGSGEPTGLDSTMASSSVDGGLASVVAEFLVDATGIVRIRYEELVAEGIDLRGVKANALAVTARGKPVPVHLDGRGNNFGPGWSLEFRAEAMDTIYTGTNVYRLHIDRDLALRTARHAGNVRRAVGWYMEDRQVDRDLQYSPAAPGHEPWYERWAYSLGSPVHVDLEVQVDELATDAEGGSAEVWIDVLGFSDWPADRDHHVALEFNGTRVAESYFDGFEVQRLSAEVPSSSVRDGTNHLRLVIIGDTGQPYDSLAIDRYGIRYPRRAAVLDGRLDLVARHPTRVALQGGDAVALGLRADGSVIRVAHAASRNRSAGIGLPDHEGGTAWSIAVDGATLPVAIRPMRQPAPAMTEPADYLVIAHPLFIDSEPLNALVGLHESEGYDVRVVDVGDVMAVHGHGVFDARAIQRYIAESVDDRGVRYVLLVGSDSYDYRDRLGFGSLSLLPTLYAQTGPIARWAPADSLLADVDDDGLQDVAIGRMPVRDIDDLNAVVRKTLAYRDADYARTSMFTADELDGGLSFTSMSERLILDLPEGWNTTRAYVDEDGVVGARTALIDAIEDGVGLVSYMGHSSSTAWTFKGLFDGNRAAALNNAGRPTVVAQWGCWNTYFVSVRSNTLAHRLMIEGDQGAAAVLGSSTLAEAHAEFLLGKQLIPRMTRTGMPIGDAILQAKRALVDREEGSDDVVVGWTLLGDPLLELSQ